MVSNAVRHSGGTPEHQIEIQARLSSKLLEISVHNQGSPITVLSSGTDREELDIGGLGLLLVEQLSDRWGTARPDGHVVWAQFLI